MSKSDDGRARSKVDCMGRSLPPFTRAARVPVRPTVLANRVPRPGPLMSSASFLHRLQSLDNDRRAAFFAEPEWVENDVVLGELRRVAVEVALDELDAILV